MKKILVVNVVLIGEESGTGCTLNSIFCNYPQTDIMQVSLQIAPQNYKTTVDNTLFISSNCIPIDYGVRRLLSLIRNKKKRVSDLSILSANIPQKNLKGALHDFFRGLLDMSYSKLNKEIMNKIKLFKPDAIYTCGSTIRIHKIVNTISKKLDVPIILHLMDDWPETIYTSSFLSSFAKTKIMKELYITHLLSKQNFAISNSLCKKYEGKYHKPYIALMNPAKYIVSNPIISDNSTVEFVYAGSLSLNRWRSLLEIAKGIYELNLQGKHACLKLYIPSSWNSKEINELFRQFNVEINNYVANSKVYEVYSKADVLVHVESFDESFSRFTKYSLSTKIPEYMGAGKPILAYVPHELYGGCYIRENKAGLVANNLDELKLCLTQMIDDKSYRLILANGGIICARNNLSVDSTIEKLNNVLSFF
jgi:glycosyltransferase involved in cell wall biosynthesis